MGLMRELAGRKYRLAYDEAAKQEETMSGFGVDGSLGRRRARRTRFYGSRVVRYTPWLFSCVLAAQSAFLPVAHALDPIPGPIPAKVLSVYDGDTIKVLANTWPGTWVETSVRVNGIDTPEIKGKCDEEKRLALMAKRFVISMVKEKVELRNVFLGKFAGRVVADVVVPDDKVGKDLGVLLVQAGLARPYSGGKREGWCEPSGGLIIMDPRKTVQ